MLKEKKNIHAGHRQRMKQEFLTRGLEGWPDHRAMELLLFFSIPRGDVNPLAHTLINRFGSVSKVLEASYEQLLAVEGVGMNTAVLIRFISDICKRCLQQKADLSNIYKDSPEFKALLEPEFFGERNEVFYLVCLDGKKKLISINRLDEGEPNSVRASPRKVMEIALGVNACLVVLAHNHPSGLPIPSTEDIAATLHLARSLSQVGITLHDHLVFGDGDAVSMRDSGYLKGYGT